MEGFTRLKLVPVEIFGLMCDDHPEDRPVSWGMMDAVSSWSDCNRADGKIYRVDESDSELHREPGETVEIWVRDDQVAFFSKTWGEGYNSDPEVSDMFPPSAISPVEAETLRLEIRTLKQLVADLRVDGAW